MGWPSSSIRRSDGRTIKKEFLGKPDGRRKAGRPKVRWRDCGEKDLKPSGSQEVEEERRRHVCMGYHSEGEIG